MKNYYDELEVSKTASQEVISKVYKMLAKKYHPDMNQGDNQQEYEEKFKKISEAYEVLSDIDKRKKYDLELEESNPTISYEEYLKVVNEMNLLKNTLTELKSAINNNNNNGSYNSNFHQYQNINDYNDQYYNNHNQSSFDKNLNNNSSSKTSRCKYYYTSTGKPASAFDYYKYKIKDFFSSLFLLIMSIILALLIFSTFSNTNFLDFIFKILK